MVPASCKKSELFKAVRQDTCEKKKETTRNIEKREGLFRVWVERMHTKWEPESELVDKLRDSDVRWG